jgi:probable dihydroxyacetone kinase regulator
MQEDYWIKEANKNNMAQRTKRAIANSLNRILQYKPITRVTISDITQDCGINRMTFYYHFKDIYDLVEWIFVDAANRMVATKSKWKSWEDGLLRIFQILKENRIFIMNVYRHVSREHIENYLDRVLSVFVAEVVMDRSVCEEEKQFAIDFYKYAIVGVILEWIRNDMKANPQIYVQYISNMIRKN